MISVIIPARDVASVIGGQLGALAAQEVSGPWEVIVADNGSRDGTREAAAAWIGCLPSLRLVDASARPGVSHARNAAAAVAQGTLLLFCDADDEVRSGWVAAMAHALQQAEVVGGRVDRRRLSEPGRLRHPEADGLTQWVGCPTFASGATLGVRADVFHALGGFDEAFVAGADDVEFSWRAHRAGHSVGFAGDAVVDYRERSGLIAVARQSYGYGVRDPQLYARFRADLMPASGWRQGLRSWAHLVVFAPRYLRSPASRAQWLRSCTRRVGRIVGSVRQRTLYL